MFKAGSSEDVVAFLEADTVDAAIKLMGELDKTQFQGKNFVAYGQNINPLQSSLQNIPELSTLV